MAADPLQAETITSILRDFERRLRNLETAPRAVATSVSAGAFSINDADGNELVRLGLLDDGGNYGIQITNDVGGRVFRVTQNGIFLLAPTVPRSMAVPVVGTHTFAHLLMSWICAPVTAS